MVIQVLATSLVAFAAPRADIDNGLSVGFARTQYQQSAISVEMGSKLLVSFFNGSDKPVKLLTERCSWGYEAVSFEVTNPGGGTYEIMRRPKPWFKNVPSPVVVEPGAVLVRSIDFGDGTWQGFPPGIAGTTEGWKVRTMWTVTPERLLSDMGFWTGKIASPRTTATLAVGS